MAKERRPDEKFCSDCGEVISLKAEICPKCGVRQKGAAGAKDKTVAALLALFLGDIGIQFFYLKRPIAGVLCLLFFWTFIPVVIGLVHGIALLMSSQADFDAKYNC